MTTVNSSSPPSSSLSLSLSTPLTFLPRRGRSSSALAAKLMATPAVRASSLSEEKKEEKERREEEETALDDTDPHVDRLRPPARVSSSTAIITSTSSTSSSTSYKYRAAC